MTGGWLIPDGRTNSRSELALLFTIKNITMENLTKKEFDFTTEKEFMGRYIGSDEKGHEFEDVNTERHYIPKTVHTDKGVKQIEVGAVCKIVKTDYGHDVYLLDAAEVEQMFVKNHTEQKIDEKA